MLDRLFAVCTCAASRTDSLANSSLIFLGTAWTDVAVDLNNVVTSHVFPLQGIALAT